jgi:diguanylate cyclase (GGDEF)-like protein
VGVSPLSSSGHAAGQAGRFLLLLHWLAPIALGLAAVETVAAAFFRSPSTLRVALVLWAFEAVFLLARSQAQRGSIDPALTSFCVGLQVATLLAALIKPALFPALAFVPLLAVAVALPLRAATEMWRLIISSWCVSVGVILVGELSSRRMAPPDPQIGFFRIGALATTLALVLLLLWQFSKRLNDALADTQAGNLALQQVLSEVKRAEEQVKNLAYHDPLTGLPNRLLCADRLRQALAQARRELSRLAVLYLDLDQFKVINDSLGHACGDTLLRIVAGRLESSLRAGDTVARLGGDEFLLVLPGADEGAALRCTQKVRESLRQPLMFEGHELLVTASIGISLFPGDGQDAETLVKHADIAMYRSKEAGRDRHAFFLARMGSAATERLSLESGLWRALSRAEFTLHYQPILELATGRITAVEALIRWRHPEHGLVWPEEFIPVAETTGLIHPLTEWVLRRVCAQAKEWQRAGFPDLVLAVNLAPRELGRADLVDQVARCLEESGLPARSLELEITESSAIQDAELTLATLRRLKGLGVRLAMDDFGVGYSSLSYLKRFPLDTLKIDEFLLREVDTEPEDAAIVRAVIAMAHTLKLSVVAEGVETEDQRIFLSQHGCDAVQGYFFSHPVPVSECLELLMENARQAERLPRGARVLNWPVA